MRKHVLIIKGRPAAKFDALDKAHEAADDDNYKVLSNVEDVKKLSKRAKMKLFHALLLLDAPRNVSPDLLWKMLQDANLRDFRKKSTAPKGPSIRERIRRVLEDGEEHGVIELALQFKTNKTAIVTAISDLRSPDYCGKGGPMKIVRSEMGGYRYVRD